MSDLDPRTRLFRGHCIPFVPSVSKLAHERVKIVDGSVVIFRETGVQRDPPGAKEFGILEMRNIFVTFRPFGIGIEPVGSRDQLHNHGEHCGGTGYLGHLCSIEVSALRKDFAIVMGGGDVGCISRGVVCIGGVVCVRGIGGGVRRTGGLDDELVTSTNRFPNNAVKDAGIGEVLPFTEEGVANAFHRVRDVASNLLRRTSDEGSFGRHL